MFDNFLNSRFRYDWDSKTVIIDGSFEARLRKGSENQQLLIFTACIGAGDWTASPFHDGRDEDDVRAVTQKTATLVNRHLKTIRIATRKRGTQIRIEER